EATESLHAVARLRRQGGADEAAHGVPHAARPADTQVVEDLHATVPGVDHGVAAAHVTDTEAGKLQNDAAELVSEGPDGLRVVPPARDPRPRAVQEQHWPAIRIAEVTESETAP